jgi:hypothetical protein
MAKHYFVIGLSENDVVVGTQCARCSQIVFYVNGVVPEEILQQECPVERDDRSQAAARIATETAEKV